MSAYFSTLWIQIGNNMCRNISGNIDVIGEVAVDVRQIEQHLSDNAQIVPDDAKSPGRFRFEKLPHRLGLRFMRVRRAISGAGAVRGRW